ncbi:uncharacterized protein LOC101890539 [Musca domestica]|uniref:Uncharacterized protein LOC101890539 n=1 Tax=Musca domestica TaxID=7370 RepID=A0A1I8MLT7_MUSDO|nr:uncharacterized protein LOC101890539 [Musca domestica]
MMKILCVVTITLALLAVTETRPQDLQTGVIMAAAQVKEAFDNGAAARYDKTVEVFGTKWKNDMEVGFGDAIKKKKRSSSDSDSSSDGDDRRKRSIVYDELADDIKALYENILRI